MVRWAELAVCVSRKVGCAAEAAHRAGKCCRCTLVAEEATLTRQAGGRAMFILILADNALEASTLLLQVVVHACLARDRLCGCNLAEVSHIAADALPPCAELGGRAKTPRWAGQWHTPSFNAVAPLVAFRAGYTALT